MAEEQKSIDQAIASLQEYIDRSQRSARKVMLYLVYFSLPIFMIGFMSWAGGRDGQLEKVIYALVAVFVVVFGVLMALYRFHLVEIAKAEQWKVGFIRIRIAANNCPDGFQSEVRTALTERAFDYPSSSLLPTRNKSIESPLPGHPTSDIGTAIINKLLSEFELKKKEK